MTDVGSQRKIVEVCKRLFAPGEVHELRILNTPRGTVSGYYNDWERLAADAVSWSGRAESVYTTLNPCNPALIARSENRFKERARTTTSDADILTRRWLLIDFDPVRPAGISSTDEEHSLAIERAKLVMNFLRQEHGWQADAILPADSGNGAHLLCRVDLPNDDESRGLLETVLKGLAQRFDDERVKVDQTTFNAARICTLYGTMKCKGDGTAERPHRLSRLFSGQKRGDA